MPKYNTTKKRKMQVFFEIFQPPSSKGGGSELVPIQRVTAQQLKHFI